MMRLLFVALVVLVSSISGAETEKLLLQKPALSRTQIVFSYAGDLWSVRREGGDATRLTTGPGVETDPVFSPDGTLIAFTGEYDGNVDVFVMPASGGIPKRLTYHPGEDIAVGWTPDGKRVVFASGRNTPNDGQRLFTMPIEGGFPDELPLPIAGDGSYSPDGSHVAYVPLFQWQAAWKRYRGGQTRKIWIADLGDSSIVPIPRKNSNDFNPMWVGDRVYFLSDRNGPVSLFCYDTRSKEVKQLIENHGLDFKSASAGPGAIVYEQFGSLSLYDLKSEKTKPVEVHLAGDITELRPHFVNVAKRLRDPHISPNGARAVFAARGDIITVPAEKGDPRNITNTVDANERSPVWSPDGNSIAYFSDESGEYALHLRDENGLGEVRKFKLGEKPAFYNSPIWSPDSKKIAYLDNHVGVWYIDLDKKSPVLVDKDYYYAGSDMSPAWSSDSNWLAYSKGLASHMRAIRLYSLSDARSTQVTDGMSEARSPVFDKDGKYLYFTASTDSGESMESDIHSFSRPVTHSIYLLVLSKDLTSPLAPESDDEKAANEKKKEEAKKDEEKKDEKDKTKPPEKVDVKIDFDNIGQRILALPMPPRRYIGLQIGRTGVLYAIEAPPRGMRFEGGPTFTIHRFDLSKRKSDVVVEGVRGFQISFSGEKMLYQQGDKWLITAPKPMADGKGPPPPPAGGNEGALKTENIEVRVDPRAEWKEMYHEVWRIERDFFYDPGYHGLDLKTAEKSYEPYLKNIASRRDLNYLFTEMLGEMTVGHMFIGGGDSPEVKRVQTGLLGADYKIENGRYRFARVYNGENWNPDLKAPLTQPGVNVVAGEYVLAVNGRELRPPDNIYGFFEATAGKSVVLKVSSDPSGAKAREVTVVPIPDESNLRHLAWIEDNRRKVDQMTNGRVAYVHMPDTGFGGYTAFNRYFFAQVGKEAAIIDERFNHGGALATDIIEYLKRPVMSLVTFRDGADLVQPQGAIFGPKVMIINEFAGSGGDAMPWYFHRFGVGKLVGKRTWGGLVGIFGFPELMDGGRVTAPNAAVWNPDGEFDVENRGIAPDIDVELDPKVVREGHDPQLEMAVQVVLEELKEKPVPQPKRPQYPNYHANESSTKAGGK
ncbi:MAG TPA: PDZ domain-containing protein [Bryobacteraceae bacterium]|nr:PDZ domain-containing protein [Bryobacteraceae bacterium]HXR14670.1 PDZ domain-containing protein [Terriglobales bacterium]HZW95688.1 PDZ domain-containing protein [Candidatus Eremiobacteraceae bacterium]